MGMKNNSDFIKTTSTRLSLADNLFTANARNIFPIYCISEPQRGEMFVARGAKPRVCDTILIRAL
jgi:hypothetical protein